MARPIAGALFALLVLVPRPATAAGTGFWTRFLAGGAGGLALHEGGHLAMNGVLGGRPEIHGVRYAGIPFFAISPTAPLTPREGFAITSAGFAVQHAGNEWLLRAPLSRRGPAARGILAFNLGTSVVYAVAAFGRLGPPERDTLGMADGLGVPEPWIGALVLAPAALDGYRVLHPEKRWPVWISRGLKVGLVAAVLFARNR